MPFHSRGYATLLVTVFLVIAMLLLTLGSHRNTFFEIKKVRNQLLARSHAWQAEGGMECIYAQVQKTGAVPAAPEKCGGNSGLSLSATDLGSGRYELASQFGQVVVKRRVSASGSVLQGALQASANLHFHSSFSVYTPDPGKETDDGWECTAITYRNYLHLGASFDNKGIVHGNEPWNGFNTENTNPATNISKDCATTHKTIVGTDLKQDMVKDSNVSPFRSFFGESPANHNRVRDSGQFKIFRPPEGVRFLADCGKVLTDAINGTGDFSRKYDKLWVEGGCEIQKEHYSALTEATQTTDGVLIVVHDGPVSLMGKPETNAGSPDGNDSRGDGDTGGSDPGSDNSAVNLPFKGSLVAFNHDYTPKIADWKGTQAYDYINATGGASDFGPTLREKAGFYQHGAFTFSGGMFLDMPDQYALFYTSFALNYNRDVINKTREDFNQPKWEAGSWHDF